MGFRAHIFSPVAAVAGAAVGFLALRRGANGLGQRMKGPSEPEEEEEVVEDYPLHAPYITLSTIFLLAAGASACSHQHPAPYIL